MRPKTEIKMDGSAPGPGAYEPNFAPAREHHTSTRIGTEARGGDILSAMPGPGQYFENGKSELGRIGTRIGTEERGQTRLLENPGPGNYDLMYDYTKPGHGITMAPKLTAPDRNNQLGPGAYDPSLNPVRVNATSKTFGINTRDDLKPNQVPGPGTYEQPNNKPLQAWR